MKRSEAIAGKSPAANSVRNAKLNTKSKLKLPAFQHYTDAC